jgi:hypothetical protein
MYVFDTSSLSIVLKHYYPERFPSLWEKFGKLISDKRILLVREVYNEIIRLESKTRLLQWAKDNRDLFEEPSVEELEFVREIFRNNHFQQLVRKRERLTGKPVADPFVIAKAKIENATLLTEEKLKENAAGIPNVCEHFKIPYTNLEGFMQTEKWTF